MGCRIKSSIHTQLGQISLSVFNKSSYTCITFCNTDHHKFSSLNNSSFLTSQFLWISSLGTRQVDPEFRISQGSHQDTAWTVFLSGGLTGEVSTFKLPKVVGRK